jgi:murein DD-endopeptidase MepM/ murein hydrolase activator NlpD
MLVVASCAGAPPHPEEKAAKLDAPVAHAGLDMAVEQRPSELSLARITNVLGVQLVPQDLVDRLVRWQNGVRDLVRSAADALAEQFAPPDLTVLTSDPIATMRTDESSGFGWRDDPIRHRRQFHAGADFRSQPGVEVLAAGDGVVVFTGWYYGYGQMIDVDHGGGVVTRYAHLSRISTKKDATITAGQPIGRVGMTGRTTGPHLHFEVRLGGRPVSPVTAMWVGEIQRSSPAAGRVAAFALAPALQALAQDGEDQPAKQHSGQQKTRPERRNGPKRSQVLW